MERGKPESTEARRGRGGTRGARRGQGAGRAGGAGRCFFAFFGSGRVSSGQTPEFSIFGQGSRGSGGVPRGSLRGRRSRDLGRGLSDGVSEYTCGWVAQRKLAMGEALHLRGCIRPVSNNTTHCPSSKGVSRCRA